MNHTDEIVAKVREKLSTDDDKISVAETKRILAAVVSTIVELSEADGVAVAGLGVFKYKTYAARAARNPQTGAAMQIPQTTRLKFRAAKQIAKI